MQSVSLCDKITLTKRDGAVGQKITITCNNPQIPCDERNLCYRCAKAYFEAAGINVYDLSIHIDKIIPMAAGLAGGSSDGAAVLKGLNSLYNGGFSVATLCDIGKKIGADIPFCIRGGSYKATGIGEILTPCPSLPKCSIVIACGGEGVSTPWAYGLVDNNPDKIENCCSVDEIIKSLEVGDIYKITSNMKNVFEDVVLGVRPTADLVRNAMIESGAIRAMMSGSGPSVFGVFTDEQSAKKVCEKISEIGVASYICEPYCGDV